MHIDTRACLCGDAELPLRGFGDLEGLPVARTAPIPLGARPEAGSGPDSGSPTRPSVPSVRVQRSAPVSQPDMQPEGPPRKESDAGSGENGVMHSASDAGPGPGPGSAGQKRAAGGRGGGI